MFSERTVSTRVSTAIGVLAVFVLTFTGAAVTSSAADVTSLLQQSQSAAAQIRRDAVQMETFSRSNLSWQSHAHQISMIKEHVNRLGQLVSQMNDAKSGATHAQQTAIDRITPLLQELASNTTDIINHLNEHKGRTWTPDYKTYLAENAQVATELSAAVRDFVEYGQTKSRAEELGNKLGFGES